MYKVLKADKDSYITDRVVKGVRTHSASVGAAGSLDLFKLYGISSSGSIPNIELSRLLVHFDLDPLRDLVAAGKIDTSNPSFFCTLKLFDVFGGQTTPQNFTVIVHPLSRSFDEGIGRDIVFYSDHDVCNFLSGSRTQGSWVLSGAAAGGHVTGNIDYITTATLNGITSSLGATQLFVTGEEDLEIDVTTIISATLSSILPDEGLRIALTSSLEEDNHTYFVKRFASRTAYNQDKHPRLLVGFDDSIQDDSLDLVFDSSGSLFLYNYIQGTLANLVSGNVDVTGSNGLVLKLETAISAGFYNLIFTGSQHQLGENFVVGTYSSSVFISSSDSVLATKLAESGSVNFTPIWGSLDGTVAYHTGSIITAYPPRRGSVMMASKPYVVTILGLSSDYYTNEEASIRVNIFDRSLPNVVAVKIPVILPGSVIRSVYWQVRDNDTGLVVVPFDDVKNSTRVSSDGAGMYFTLDMSNLTSGKTYVIDVMIKTNGTSYRYKNVSSVFRVNDTQ